MKGENKVKVKTEVIRFDTTEGSLADIVYNLHKKLQALGVPEEAIEKTVKGVMQELKDKKIRDDE